MTQSLEDTGAGICPTCGLPKPELCTCVETEREGTTVNIRTEKRRYGKDVTIVEGISSDDVNEMGTTLKKYCACGGTVKEGSIELQGNHVEKIKQKLQEMGLNI